jgi:hypothetical protein
MAKINFKYFIGDSLPHKWVSVYNYRPQSAEILEQKGEVFAVFSLFAPEGFNSATAGNLLIDYFHEQYFESKKESVIASLEVAIGAVRDRLTELLVNEEEVASAGVEFDMAAIAVRGEEIYFASFGDSKIMVLPDQHLEEIIDITSSLRDQFGKGIIKVGSSFLQPDQRFILSTKNFASQFGEENLLPTMRTFSDLRLKNHEYANPEEVACLLIGADLREESEALPEEEPALAAGAVGTDAAVGRAIDASGSIDTDGSVEASDAMETGGFTRDDEALEPLGAVGTEELAAGVAAVVGNDLTTDSLLDPGITTDTVESASRSDSAVGAGETIMDDEYQPPTESTFMRFVRNTRKKVGGFIEAQKLARLQRIRERGQGPAFDRQSAMGRQSAEGRLGNGSAPIEGAAQMTTIQLLLARIGQRLARMRDFMLYDVLRVNQNKPFQFGRDPGGKVFVKIFAIRLNQNALLVLAAVVLVVLVYSAISSIGAERERSNQLLAARDSLTLIKQDIAEIEASPVLNSRSSADIPQRQKLLTEIETLEAKFTENLALLPQGDVDAAKSSVAALKQKALKVRKPALNLVLDSGAIFAGSIADMTRSGENLFALDRENGKIYRQPINGSTAQEAFSGLDNPQAIVADGSGNLVIYNAGADNVVAIYNPVNNTLSSVAGISVNNLPGVKRLALYDTTNALYTVAAGDSKVQLLNRVGKNYSLPNVRYAEPEGSEIRDVKIVNKQVFALVAGKGIVRVGTDGAKLEAFSDVITAAQNASVFGYDEDYLYIVDEPGKRLLVFNINRAGQPISDFVAQIDISAVSGNINQVVADKAKGLVFLSDSSKIYSFNRTEI